MPHSQVRAQRQQATTDHRGRFSLCGLPSTPSELAASAAGYRPAKRTLAAADNVETVEIPLHREFATALFADPLRALQTAPGIAATNDFYADFAWRAAATHDNAFYLDGVRLATPFHQLEQIGNAASMSLLNTELTEAVTLVTAPSAKYAETTAAAIRLDTRAPSRNWTGRFAADLLQSIASAEGPLGAHAAWLVTARKSYSEDLMRALGHADLALAFYDVESKLQWDPAPHHRLSLLALDATTGLDMTGYFPMRHAGIPNLAQSRVDLAQPSWTWTPQPSVQLRTSVAYTRDAATNHDAVDLLLLHSFANSAEIHHDAAFRLSPHQTLEAGAEFEYSRLRYLRNDSWDAPDRPLTAAPLLTIANFASSRRQSGGYAQDAFRRGRWSLVAGGRADHLGSTGETVWQPRASLSYRLSPRADVSASFADYARFPTAIELFGPFPNPHLRAQRSRDAQLETRLRLEERTSLRVALYNRAVRRITDSEQTFWRIAGGQIQWPRFGAPLRDSLRAYSRGLEVTLERRATARLSGWVSYAWGHARADDTLSGAHFDADFDQRHLVNALATWRPHPLLLVTSRFRYTSNFPVPGYYRGDPAASTPALNLSDQRNALRMPAYSTLDLQCSREWFLHGFRVTLYGAVTNMLNRRNYRFIPFNNSGFSVHAGWMTRDTMLPALPSGGFTLDF